jgi:hypothetical protein
MSFEVIWRRAAENELANIWMNSTDRDAITRASAILDRMLEDEADRRRIPHWLLADRT